MKSVTPSHPAYTVWLSDLKRRISKSQIRAAVKVNDELLRLYWSLGKDISEKQAEATWGRGFFAQLSRDLKTEFPDAKGFSSSNLKYMKRFYEFYNQCDTIRQQLVDELQCNIFFIPWRHHIEIMTNC